MKDFSAILDTYFRALQKLRDHNKLVEDTVSIFKPDKKSIFTPPMDLEFKKGGASNFKRADRVQVLKEETEKEGELMFPEDDGALNWDMPDDEEDSREDSHEEPQGIQTAEHQRQDNEFRAVAQGDADSESDREDAWLAAIQYTPGKKRVCFEFAKRGTCERLKTQGHCPYSHDDEDCEKFRAAKKLGKDTIENIAKEIKNRAPQGRSYEKTHTDGSPRASSPGARSILQRQPGAGGSARRS